MLMTNCCLFLVFSAGITSNFRQPEDLCFLPEMSFNILFITAAQQRGKGFLKRLFESDVLDLGDSEKKKR